MKRYAFTIIHIQNEISGEITGCGVNDKFTITSGSPLSYKMTDNTHPGNLGTYSFAKSIAKGPYVYVAIDQPGHDIPNSEAAAKSKIDFTPNFDGCAKEILFYGSVPAESWFAGPKVSWTITDLTLNTLIAFNTPFHPGDFSQQLIYSDFNVSTNDNEYFWDSSHTYELKLLVQAGSNHATDMGWIKTNMFRISLPILN